MKNGTFISETKNGRHACMLCNRTGSHEVDRDESSVTGVHGSVTREQNKRVTGDMGSKIGNC